MQKNSALWILRATDGCVSDLKYGTWTISSYEPADARALCAAGFSPITAALLCSRGYRDAGAAREFLSCSTPLSSPFDLLDMDKAAARVKQALARREHIAVFGDYDVDGITATCLLTEYLRSRGGHVTSYIPARLEEGYGLNPIAIDTLKKQGVELIVTVDCGITANQEAALCRELGIDLVITDHHECKSELPQAVALVNPHRKDQPQPVTEMAGVGVAFKLAAAIEGEQETLLDQYCDFLCLGTVADVMPLTGENRTMVARGLKALENPRRVGIAALMAECSVQKGPVTAGTIGYTLAPRINAAGRMGEVGIATELFLTHDAGRAVELAGALCRLGLALAGAVLVLKLDIVLDLIARIEQLVQAHAIEFGERDQVLGIGRALRALPFTDRLARQPQLSRQPFLAKTLAATKVGEPLRSFYIHGSSYVMPAVPPDRFCS